MLSIAAGRDLRAQALEVPIETRAQRVAFELIGAGLRHHDEVPGRQRALRAEGLAREALQAIPIDGSLRDATRDREAQACDVACARAREHREEFVARADRVREDPPEFLRRVEALSGREPRRARRGR